MKAKLSRVLRTKIDNGEVKILFIPFKLKAIETAFDNFGVNDAHDKSNGVY
ncbi:MAG: hypothetical protein LBK73_03670 [Treponema sp.]|nr:hypothetical protein [Treponema sp.]